MSWLDEYLKEKISEEPKPGEASAGEQDWKSGEAGGGRGFVHPPTVQELQAEKDSREKQAMIAAGGAGVGAAARYKGKNLMGFLAPGEGVFAPSPERVEFVNKRLREMTRSPGANLQGMTPEQAERLLQGGEGPTLGTSGRQRGETFNLETQRRARAQNQIESLVRNQFPGTAEPITSVGEPLVQTRSGFILPQSAATQQAEQQAAQAAERAAQQAAEAERATKRARESLQRSGIVSGVGKMGQGALGGALMGLQGYGMATQKEPIDWTQWLSLSGSPLVTFGGPKLGLLGGLAQVPYAIRHRENIARGMTLGDISPTMFGGTGEVLETPIGNLMPPK